MQQEEKENTQETEVLKRLFELEDLAEKKTKIYARLLIDPTLADKMENLSLQHQQRKERIYALLYGVDKNMSKRKKDGGMSEVNEKMEKI